MKEIKILEHERRSIVNQLMNNLSKQNELRNKADLLKTKLLQVQNKIIKLNSKK